MAGNGLDREAWDCLIVGTGVGGATLGYSLAARGWRVLFVEKGRAGFSREDTIRGDYPELHGLVDETSAQLLARGGRWTEPILDGARTFVPLIGSGTGGSSALFGMAMERFRPCDFDGSGGDSADEPGDLPPAWPISFGDLAPWYGQAERLYRVRGERDPLLPPIGQALLSAPPPSPQNIELHAHFQARGLHPYRLPLACEWQPDCRCCQGYLCERNCKNDASRICLEPAMRDHGAHLIEGCEAVRLEADRKRVTGVVCRYAGAEQVLRASRVVLAAGALSSPRLLLDSASATWPDGLANSSGLVGRHLMRHLIDLHLVMTRAGIACARKEIGVNDFYANGRQKGGTLQSFGVLPPPSLLAAAISDDLRQFAPWAAPLFRLTSPLVRTGLRRLLERGVLLASILEDRPHVDNRVLVDGGRLRIDYRIHAGDKRRLHRFRRQIRKALSPYRVVTLAQAGKNAMVAHACGTCRFGTDPALSVLGPDNRAHDLENLWVVDGSFFPTSGGTNPALTIAANALRVADTMTR